jgi:hypothetical protein
MTKKIYTFNKTDSGIYGKAFEMEIKRVLKRKNADTVTPQGKPDFRYNHKNYDAKQNGTIVEYGIGNGYIKGSNRVIYATHIDFTVTAEDNDSISFVVNLEDTAMFVLDKKEFVEHLLSINKTKLNKSRNAVNVQTAYNYKKDNYHGSWGKEFELWAFDNQLEDPIIDDILAGLI